MSEPEEVPQNGAPTPEPGVLTFRFDPATGALSWEQRGAFPLPALVNALELCKFVQVQRQLQEQLARQLAEQATKIQPAPGGLPPRRLFRG